MCITEEGFAYLGSGYAFRELGASDWAIQDLDSATEIDPLDHESWVTRATCYEELGADMSGQRSIWTKRLSWTAETRTTIAIEDT